jgi:hypothetical protein
MATQTGPGYRPEAGSEDDAAGAHARSAAQRAAGQTQERAQQAAGQAQVKAREQVDQRSSQLAEQAHQHASDLRSVSTALRDEGKHGSAQAVDRLAGYAERASTYLRDTDADSLLSDAEDFGRRKPGAVAAAALAAGLVASRFLKASGRRRYSARRSSQPVSSSTATAGGAGTPETIEPRVAAASSQPAAGSGI